MPAYDLDAYLAADRETGWASDMMVARQSPAQPAAEYQAIVDLCAAFLAGAFDCSSHYWRADLSEDRLAVVLAENAPDPYPSYALLLRIVEQEALERRGRD